MGLRQVLVATSGGIRQEIRSETRPAFINVKPKDWYFVLDLVQFRTGLGCVRIIM